jgi:hypothetical protein
MGKKYHSPKKIGKTPLYDRKNLRLGIDRQLY